MSRRGLSVAEAAIAYVDEAGKAVYAKAQFSDGITEKWYEYDKATRAPGAVKIEYEGKLGAEVRAALNQLANALLPHLRDGALFAEGYGPNSLTVERIPPAHWAAVTTLRADGTVQIGYRDPVEVWTGLRILPADGADAGPAIGGKAEPAPVALLADPKPPPIPPDGEPVWVTVEDVEPYYRANYREIHGCDPSDPNAERPTVEADQVTVNALIATHFPAGSKIVRKQFRPLLKKLWPDNRGAKGGRPPIRKTRAENPRQKPTP